MNPSASHPPRVENGFSLIELMVVMIIVGTLTTLGIAIFGKTASSARRTAVDQFTAAVEQARTSAMTRRKPVILAIAPPAATSTDKTCRFGLFEVDELPEPGADLNARQLQRWNSMPDGVVFFGGSVQGLGNVVDGDKVKLTWKNGENQALVHVLVFTPRGGLARPTGSEPVAVKLGTGFYRDAQPMATPASGHNSLRIGRIVARPWKLDG